MKAVIDTNVLLVANEQHADISPDCVIQCVEYLRKIQDSGVVVIDDEFRILEEYQHKTNLKQPKGAGDVFLKWLLRNRSSRYVEQVQLNEVQPDHFSEFPDAELEPAFDPPDRKFVAVASAHPDKPPIWQAADCKWLDWWPALRQHGVNIEFLCPEDACRFYRSKFPGKPVPSLPPPQS